MRQKTLNFIAISVGGLFGLVMLWEAFYGGGFLGSRGQVVLLGDSFVYDPLLVPEQRLDARLRRLMDQDGLDCTLTNGGFPGDTSEGVAERLRDYARPSLVVIIVGANDMLLGWPAARTRLALDETIREAQIMGSKVVLVGMAPLDVVPASERQTWGDLYRDLAAEHDLVLHEDILAELRGQAGLFRIDGLHPSDHGVVIMAQALYRTIKPALIAAGC